MPTAAQEAYEVAKAARDANGEPNWELCQAEYERRLAERHRRPMTDARAAYRAMDGRGRINSREEWEQNVAEATAEYQRGAFLIEQLGAERHLAPTLMAVLLVLRRRLVDEHGATTAAELMLIDLAVLSYYHTLRIDGWDGNFAALIGAESFQKESPTAKFTDKYGRYDDKVRGFSVEDHVERFAEQLLPLLDSCEPRLPLRHSTSA